MPVVFPDLQATLESQCFVTAHLLYKNPVLQLPSPVVFTMSMGFLKRLQYRDVVEAKAERRPVKIIYNEANKTHFEFTFSHVIQHSSTELEKQMLYQSTRTQIQQITELIQLLESHRASLLSELEPRSSLVRTAISATSQSHLWGQPVCSSLWDLSWNQDANGILRTSPSEHEASGHTTQEQGDCPVSDSEDLVKTAAIHRNGAFTPVKSLQLHLYRDRSKVNSLFCSQHLN